MQVISVYVDSSYNMHQCWYGMWIQSYYSC